MAITRSGTPTSANTTSAVTSLGIAIPSAAAAGSLCFIAAFSDATGAWPAAPTGWSVVANTTQTALPPACQVLARILQAGDPGTSVAVTSNAGALALCAFAYTGVQATDVSGAQRNGSSSSCTAPALTPTSSADMLVMIGGAPSTAAVTFTGANNGLTLWGTANSTAVADKQLTSAAGTGSSTITLSSAANNAGIQLTLLQWDGDGAGPTSSRVVGMALRPWNRAAQLASLGRDEQFAAATDDGALAPPPRPRALGSFRLPLPTPAGDDQPLVFDEAPPAPPARRWDRVWRWFRQAAAELWLAPVTAPSVLLAATLERSIGFTAATLEPTAPFTATLTLPLVFGATLN